MVTHGQPVGGAHPAPGKAVPVEAHAALDVHPKHGLVVAREGVGDVNASDLQVCVRVYVMWVVWGLGWLAQWV
jgi:hypothetical protein